MFVEQPLHTDFSIVAEGSSFIRTEKQVVRDFRGFLHSFVDAFSEFYDAEMLKFLSQGKFIQALIFRRLRGCKQRIISIASQSRGINSGNDPYSRSHHLQSISSHMGLIPLAAKTKFDADWQYCLESIERSTAPVTFFQDPEVQTASASCEGLQLASQSYQKELMRWILCDLERVSTLF